MNRWVLRGDCEARAHTYWVKRVLVGVAGFGMLGVAPAAAEPVLLDQAVTEINQVCVSSRAAFLAGGTASLRLRPNADPVQVQRFDPVAGRVSDSGWPAVTQRSVGTYDRSGFVLDGRLRKAQVRQAAKYLGYRTRPWVLTRGQYGVIADPTFDAFLRSDLLAPDRLVDLDSTTVPAQPQRCASHLLDTGAKAVVDRVAEADRITWTMTYRLNDAGTTIKVDAQMVAERGVFVSGAAHLRGPALARMDLDNYATWTYQRPTVRVPKRSVSQRQWIRATDAAALVMDLRYLSGGLEGRRTLSGLRSAARKRVQMANRGHAIKFRVRDLPGGVQLSGRNPFTDSVVVFEVVLQPVPQAVARRLR